jgi:hypothetical protein
MMMGHDTGLQENYYDYNQPESVFRALTEYIKATSLLTVNDEERLKARLTFTELENTELREQLRWIEEAKKILEELKDNKNQKPSDPLSQEQIDP